MELPESTKKTLAYNFHTTIQVAGASPEGINEAIDYYIDKKHIVYYRAIDSKICLLFGDGSVVIVVPPDEENPVKFAVVSPDIVTRVLAQSFPFENIDGCLRHEEVFDEPA